MALRPYAESAWSEFESSLDNGKAWERMKGKVMN
jgi:hypothetical protein